MKPIGKVISIHSPATVIGANGSLWHLYKGNTIYPNDRIYIERDNRAVIELDNGDQIKLEGEQSWTPTTDSFSHNNDLFTADVTLPSSPKGESSLVESLLQQALAAEVTASLRNPNSLPNQSSRAQAS